MLSFTSRFPCPTRLIPGGGNGRYGLCVMEMVAVLMGAQDPDDRVLDSHSSVHEDLGLMAISLNDLGGSEVSEEQRTKGLWPIIPKLIGTAGRLFPHDAFLTALNLPEDIAELWDPRSLSYIVRSWTIRQMDDHGLSVYAKGGYAKAWAYGLEALKTAISIHCEVNEITPQEDFTSGQMENLLAYLERHQDSPYLAPLEAAAA